MISPGQLARRILGRHFHIIGMPYRRLFVNMDKVSQCMARHIPHSANVLDVGGGDGFVADALLSIRPDITITVSDLSERVGSFIKPENRNRAKLYPATDLSAMNGSYDVMTISDVLHHVPLEVRRGFLHSVAEAASRFGCCTIIVKDIEPGNLRAKFALWGDLYITGDRAVSQSSHKDIAIPGFQSGAVEMPDFPNYCAVFTR